MLKKNLYKNSGLYFLGSSSQAAKVYLGESHHSQNTFITIVFLKINYQRLKGDLLEDCLKNTWKCTDHGISSFGS